MGRISVFVCPSCDRSWEVQLGHGMGHAAFESVLDEFPPDIRQDILADTGGEQYPAFEFNYCPALCRQCQSVVPVPVIYLHQTGQTYTGACPDCGSSIAVQEEDARVLCPHCQKGILAVEEIGRWD